MKTILTKPALYAAADVSKNLTDRQINAAGMAAWSSVLVRVKDYVQDWLVYVGNSFTGDYYTGADDASYTYLYDDAYKFSSTYDNAKNIVAVGLKDKEEMLNSLLLATAFRCISILSLTAGTVITQQGALKTRRENYVDADGKALSEFVNLFNRLSDDALDRIVSETTSGESVMEKRRGTTIKTYGIWNK
jgi:hypothetical protein